MIIADGSTRESVICSLAFDTHIYSLNCGEGKCESCEVWFKESKQQQLSSVSSCYRNLSPTLAPRYVCQDLPSANLPYLAGDRIVGTL